jgi:hypothetical protein
MSASMEAIASSVPMEQVKCLPQTILFLSVFPKTLQVYRHFSG